MSVSILNTDAGLSGKTVDTLESDQTITGAKTFDRDPGAPFVVTASSAAVTNLDSDKLDGQHGSFYQDPTNLSAAVPVTKGGTGAATLTNHGVVLGQGTSAVAVTSAGTAGQVLTSNGAAADPTFQASTAAMTLIASNSGTFTTTGGGAINTVAISGLTVKDRLLVEVTIYSATNSTTAFRLRNTTDNVDVSPSQNIASNNPLSGPVDISCDQTDALTIHYRSNYTEKSTGVGTGNDVVTFTTAWTGSWNLSLYCTSGGAGFTLRYRWNVYKLAGQ